MLVTALRRSSDTVDALVGFLGRETLEGDLDSVALFFVQVVVSVIGPHQLLFLLLLLASLACSFSALD